MNMIYWDALRHHRVKAEEGEARQETRLAVSQGHETLLRQNCSFNFKEEQVASSGEHQDIQLRRGDQFPRFGGSILVQAGGQGHAQPTQNCKTYPEAIASLTSLKMVFDFSPDLYSSGWEQP